MSDTREFIDSSLENAEVDEYWSEVERWADEVIKPTVGVHQNGEVLFSWDLNDYYFEVLFSEGIEAFWKTPSSSAHFLPNSTEQAATWTIEQFQHVSNT